MRRKKDGGRKNTKRLRGEEYKAHIYYIRKQKFYKRIEKSFRRIVRKR